MTLIQRDLALLRNSVGLLDAYFGILEIYGSTLLDPIQLATFEYIAVNIADELYAVTALKISTTDLVDMITEKHLSYLDTFRTAIGNAAEGGQVLIILHI